MSVTHFRLCCRQSTFLVEALAAGRFAATPNGAVSLLDFTDETDAELLVYMSIKDDPASAREAWGEFYRRHAGYLHAVCVRAWHDLLRGEIGVEDLVAETFRRAFDCAGSFTCEETGDEDEIRRRVRAWLGRIAQRLLQDILRGRSRLALVGVEPEAWERIAQPAPVAPADDPRLALIHDAIGLLSEREQVVIRVTFQWYRPGQDHQRLPNDVVADLAATLETTPENLRQIRRRALDKIRRHLKAPAREDRDAVETC